MTERAAGNGTSPPDPHVEVASRADGRPEPDAAEPAELGTTTVTETFLPHVTIWPAAVALGTTLFAAGLITNLALVGVGAFVIALGLYGWIQEMRHEHE
jgi:hypothetical protein